MKIKMLLLAAFLGAISLTQTATAQLNEQCDAGPIVGGKQTVTRDGKFLFFDMQVMQPNRSVCIVRAGIDITGKRLDQWKTYIVDEPMSDADEILDNTILSGTMEIRTNGVATINVTLKEINSGKVWNFPEFTLIARQGKGSYK